MPLKWHHINKCNKNCRKVNVLTSILAHLSSSTALKSIHKSIRTLIFKLPKNQCEKNIPKMPQLLEPLVVECSCQTCRVIQHIGDARSFCKRKICFICIITMSQAFQVHSKINFPTIRTHKSN
jgi:hypothetical protein